MAREASGVLSYLYFDLGAEQTDVKGFCENSPAVGVILVSAFSVSISYINKHLLKNICVCQLHYLLFVGI